MNLTTKAQVAAVYARFSSELQLDRSIDDQLALCRSFAARQGFQVVEEFADRARSGASIFGRDGLLSMLERAKARAFDVVIVEALDRLSRDQEDLAAIFKRLQFIGVDIVAVHDGRADAVQIGIRGLVGSLYLTDLANKVRRGLAGRVKEGLSAGGKAYGYRPILGKPGELEIDPAEAAVVLRIFREFADGVSPRVIAASLNKDGILPPRGAVWNASTINGSATRQNGILRNSIYGGKLVWNRLRMIRDPETGKRVSRMNPESEWQKADVPHLRIVDEETMSIVTERVNGRRSRSGSYTPRNKRILSGLLVCGACGGGMTLDGKTNNHPRIRCSRSKESGSCDHHRKYPLKVIEDGVINALKGRLDTQSAQEDFIKEYVAERLRLSRRSMRDSGTIERQIAKRKQEIERLIDAYVEGVIEIRQLSERRSTIDAEISRMENELAATPVVEPGALVADARIAFDRDTDQIADLIAVAVPNEAIVAPLRRFIDRVIIHPSPPFQDIQITLAGKLEI